ncbi:MAG: tetratricopeptide repeat protein [Deltaproteobacteria bacterium]
MAKPSVPTLTLEQARAQLASDAKTHAVDPTLRWYSSQDDRVARLAKLAKVALARRDENEAWAIIAARALIECGHADYGRSCRKALEIFESLPAPDVETLRWKAHAAAVRALAGNAKGAWGKAGELYAAVIVAAPDDVSARLMVAECTRRHVKSDTSKLASKGVPLLEEALTHLDHAAVRSTPLGLRTRGLILALAGRDTEAVPLLAEAVVALRAQPELAGVVCETLVSLARAQLASAQYDAAMDTFRQSGDAAAVVRLEISRGLFVARQWPQLVALHQHQHQPQLMNVEVCHLVTAHYQLKQYAQAVALVNHWKATPAEFVDGNEAQIHYLEGITLRAMADKEGASAAFDRALAQNPTHVLAHASRAWNRFELGDLPRAAAECDDALAKIGRQKNVVHTLAAAKHGLGQHDEARALLREAFQLGDAAAAKDMQDWYGEAI